MIERYFFKILCRYVPDIYVIERLTNNDELQCLIYKITKFLKRSVNNNRLQSFQSTHMQTSFPSCIYLHAHKASHPNSSLQKIQCIHTQDDAFVGLGER